eukprot:TRINITY_DN1309_c5_g1_i1.p1 TRINITY_DN1309_c5_g1~~TRINITY_DN1309_c5_g1_i1.p1  ORF type:complete len:725 (+),score=101.26 TRINITY_DN1309_c5_g1_i1:86-2260(+)
MENLAGQYLRVHEWPVKYTLAAAGVATCWYATRIISEKQERIEEEAHCEGMIELNEMQVDTLYRLWCGGKREGGMETILHNKLTEEIEEALTLRDTVKVMALLEQAAHVGADERTLSIRCNESIMMWRTERRQAFVSLLNYAKPRAEVVVIVSILNAARPMLWDFARSREKQLTKSAKEADAVTFSSVAASYLCVALCDTFFSFLISLLKREEVEHFADRVKKRLIKHLLTLDQSFYDSNVTELAELQADVMKLRYLVTDRFFQVIRFSFVSAHALYQAFSSPGQALISLCCFSCVPLLITVRSRLNEAEAYIDGRTHTRVSRKAGSLMKKPSTTTVPSLVSRLAFVRAATAEDQEMYQILKEEEASLADSMITQTIGSRLLEALRGTIIPNALVLALSSVGHCVVQWDLLNTSTIARTVDTAIEAFENTNALYEELQDLTEADYTVRLMSVLNAKPTIDVLPATVLPVTLRSFDLRVENISFAYPTNPVKKVLNRVSFSLPLGSRLAVVGRSGSGKSSLASLLIRLYDPSEGGVYISTSNIKTLNVRWVRSKIVTVPQGATLHQETILEALLYGVPEAGRRRTDVERVCKQLGLHELITGFKQGYNTKLTTGGVQFSGGQAQRIAIARALLSKPTILVLDEATNGLDIPTERQVISTILAELGPASSLILVAHRPSTVGYCDRALCMSEGSVVEEGQLPDVMNDPSSHTYRLFRENAVLQEAL